jgi:hypothetical protein
VNQALLCLTVLTIFTSSVLAQNSINTIPLWNGSTFVSMFGSGTAGSNSGTSTYGHSIMIGAGATPLNSYSFEMKCTGNPTIRGEVYAWDGNKATGAALFEGPSQLVTGGGGFQLVTINVGGLTLPEGRYVLFVTTSKDMTTAGPSCTFGILPDGTAIPNGTFVWQNDFNPAQWTTVSWSSMGQDLAMRVDGLVFTVPAPVPAASTTSLIVGFTLLIGLGIFLLSRRQRLVT